MKRQPRRVTRSTKRGTAQEQYGQDSDHEDERAVAALEKDPEVANPPHDGDVIDLCVESQEEEEGAVHGAVHSATDEAQLTTEAIRRLPELLDSAPGQPLEEPDLTTATSLTAVPAEQSTAVPEYVTATQDLVSTQASSSRRRPTADELFAQVKAMQQGEIEAIRQQARRNPTSAAAAVLQDSPDMPMQAPVHSSSKRPSMVIREASLTVLQVPQIPVMRV